MTAACYSLHGLGVTSDIALPDARAPVRSHDDVRITRATAVTACERNAIALVGDQHRARLYLPDVATFVLADGAHIDVLAHTRDEETLRAFLLGSAWAVLLHQRGMLPLHGCALAWRGAAWLFVGESGAGKSTLAAALLRAGADLVSDDVSAITDDAGVPRIWPGLRSMKLAGGVSGSVSGLDLGPTHDFLKRRIVPERLAGDHAMRLGGVVELVRRDGAPALLERLHGSQACGVAVRHTFRGAAAPALGTARQHLAASAALADTARFYRLSRPWDLATVARTAEELLGGALEGCYPSLRSA